MGTAESKLIEAAGTKGSLEDVKEALADGANVNAHTEEGGGASALIAAARYRRTHILQLLLSVPSVNIAAVDEAGNTALHAAVLPSPTATLSGDPSVTTQLLRAGAPHSSRNRDGDTPLILAARNGYTRSVEALLDDTGIDGSLMEHRSTRTRKTAEEEALSHGHMSIVRLLKTKREAFDQLRAGVQLLDAAKSGSAAAIQAALRRGASVNHADLLTGATPLCFAVAYRHLEATTFLLERDDINIEAIDTAGRRATHYAVLAEPSVPQSRRDDPACLNALVAAGASPTPVDVSGNTPLLLASQRGCVPIVRALMMTAPVGGDHRHIAHRNAAGKSAAETATDEGHLSLARDINTMMERSRAAAAARRAHVAASRPDVAEVGRSLLSSISRGETPISSPSTKPRDLTSSPAALAGRRLLASLP